MVIHINIFAFTKQKADTKLNRQNAKTARIRFLTDAREFMHDSKKYAILRDSKTSQLAETVPDMRKNRAERNHPKNAKNLEKGR